MTVDLLLFTDIHVPDAPNDEVFQRTIEWLCDRIEAYQPRAVIHLGDTFTSMTAVSIPAMSNAVWAIESVLAACGRVKIRPDAIHTTEALFVILAGNHDQWNANRTITSLEAFKGRAMVVTEAVMASDLLLLPYTTVTHEASQWLRERVRSPQVSRIFSHLPIHDIFGIEEPLGFRAEDFVDPTRNREVFCGHYHRPMERVVRHGDFETRFHVVGSLSAASFSDELQEGDPPRGILLVHGDGRVERVANPYSPIYRTIRVDEEDGQLPDIPESDEDRMVVRIYCPSEMVDSMRQTVDYMAFRKAEIMPTKKKAEVVRRAEVQQMSLREVVEDYAERHGPPELDKARLRQVGLYFLQENA